MRTRMTFVDHLFPFYGRFGSRGFRPIGGGFVRFFFGFSHGIQSLTQYIRESIDSKGHV
jgi:hypothetical protein